tara:strand:- start:28 stop:327 length:300 start_codon:yes stop_codon:yes gene_type:complete
MTKKSKSRTRSKTMTCATCQRECQIKPPRVRCYECNEERTKPNDPEATRERGLKYVLEGSLSTARGTETKRKRDKKRKGGSRRTRRRRVRFASRRRRRR